MEPILLGGNPQIPKGEGDAPMQAWVAAMPGWEREVGPLAAPVPPGASKQKDVRYLDIREEEPFDAGRFADW